MADEIQLRIVTPRAMLLDEPALEVTAPGTAGEFGVLPNHITFLGSLEPGVLSARTRVGVRRLAVRGGFAEVLDNVMTVLVDAAQLADDIDRATAERDLRAAKDRLEDLSPADADYAPAEAERLWAEARLEAAKK
jgi:F-type H+-transporting ATPase subunit epsilon